ncbi:MAG TPA: TonB-dependent receptor [Pyrinomonadaceae bacterium]
MKDAETLGNLVAEACCLIVIFVAAVTGLAQSQALDGQIDGTVLDQSGASVPNATVTATNIGTGATRTVSTDQRGVYRIPLLPLGTYRISADASGFKRFVREGITLTTGQSATVDLQLGAGPVEETVTISGDVPVADTGKTDLGRVMNAREVHNLPLPTRNPYNFIILQANVTGRPNRGFNFPQINVNGFARRVNYLLDGNTNTRGDGAGARLLQISETYVNEIQLLTNGFAAEFGNTTGMIVNIVTPSGTNDLRGSVSYLFRRPSFYSRPFFFSASELPDNVTNNIAAKVGGPIVRDRWHFYAGYEYVERDDSTRSNRQVTISEANKADLIEAGLPPSIFVPAIPSREYGSHYIVRSDLQLNDNNRLTARFNHSSLGTINNIAGAINTLERSVDIKATDHSLGVQLVSYTMSLLNELRFHFVLGKGDTVRNDSSGSGPSVTISQVANFGSPPGAGAADRTKVAQMQNNFSITRAAHVIKFGGGFSFTRSYNLAPDSSVYTFRSIPAYLAARMESEPFRYDRYQESFGDPETEHATTFWNFFVQDDWKATRRLKLGYGLRYDFYLAPRADASSPFPASRKFNQDRNNFAPRLGLVYALREGNRPLVVRLGAGLYYEAPWGAMYERAIRNNGQRFFTLQFCGDDGGPPSCTRRDPSAPAFPARFSGTQPSGSMLPPQNIVTVSPDFVNMYAIHSNVQLEQAITDNISLAVGYVHSAGRHIPVYRSINPIRPQRFLADGRPVFGPERLDSRFNQIQMAESAGVSQYDALTLQLTQRFSRGLQFSANYTLSKAVDDAPEQNVTYMGVIAGVTNMSLVVSDPTNRTSDKGYSYGDQRHTFVMSLVARPTFNIRNKTLSYLMSNNQFGIIATANSGERFSILAGRQMNGTLSNLDLNGDGVSTADRPVGFKRNSGKTPPQFNLDLRYSRFFNFTERYKLEAFGDAQNLFNINSIIGYGNVLVPTDPTTGEIIGTLPDFKSRNSSFALESRQVQIGVRFIF